MVQKFAMSVGVKLAKDESFSLDELVYETKQMFETEGMPGFLRCFLILLDQLVYLPWLSEANKKEGCCCSSPYFVVSQREEKFLFTTAGLLNLLWTRLCCKNCGQSFIPLRRFLGLESYQKKTNELEKIVTEVVSEQSYRRTASHLETIGNIPIPHTTLHRWVMKSDCDEIGQNKKVQTIIADGTGYKRKPIIDEKTGEITNRGEVKVVVGVKLEDKLEIEKKTWEAERKIQALIQELKDRGYTTAAKYLANAKEKMFSYVRLWLRMVRVSMLMSCMSGSLVCSASQNFYLNSACPFRQERVAKRAKKFLDRT